MIRAFIVLVVLGSLSLTACNTSAPDPQDVIDVRKLLAKRTEAIKNKDFEMYRSLFLPDYFDGKYRLPDLLDDAKHAFEKYESITLTQQKAPVETKMNSARVVQRVMYDLKGRNKPIETREILLLRRTEDGWRISGGVYVGLD